MIIPPFFNNVEMSIGIIKSALQNNYCTFKIQFLLKRIFDRSRATIMFDVVSLYPAQNK